MPESTNPTTVLDLSTFAALLWDELFGQTPVPEAFVERVVAALARHVPAPARGHAEPCRATERLAELRLVIREHLADAVDETLTLEVANAILKRLGLQPLSRTWLVWLTVPISVEVTATGGEEACEAACDIVDRNFAAETAYAEIRWGDSPAEPTAVPGAIATATATL